MRECKYDDCNNTATAGKRVCAHHRYQAWKQHVDKKTCYRDDCDRPAQMGKRCMMHGRRFERHGDENYEGKVPTHHSVIDRLTRGDGRASDHACAQCGMNAYKWVYNHADPQELTGKQGEPYSRYPKYYEPLCHGCEEHMAIYRPRIRMKVSHGRKTP